MSTTLITSGSDHPQSDASKFAVKEHVLSADQEQTKRLKAELAETEARAAKIRETLEEIAKKEGMKAELAEQREVAKELQAELDPVLSRITELEELLREEKESLKIELPPAEAPIAKGDPRPASPELRLEELMAKLRQNHSEAPKPVTDTPKPVADVAPAVPDKDLPRPVAVRIEEPETVEQKRFKGLEAAQEPLYLSAQSMIDALGPDKQAAIN